MAARRTWWRWAAFGVVGVALASSPAGADPPWSPELVATVGDIFDQSFAYDPADGLPAVAFMDNATNQLKYAKKSSGGGWTVQNVATLSYTNSRIDLAFDPADGRPAIISRSGKVEYRKWTGSSWKRETVEVAGDTGAVSLVFDPQGRATVSYRKPGVGARFARRSTSGSWTKETANPNAWPHASHALDSSGNPAVVSSGDTNGNGTIDIVYLSRKNGSTWTTEVVESGVEGYGVSARVAFDRLTGSFVLAHTPWLGVPESARLRVVTWNGSSWVAEDLGPGWCPSLAFDAAGALCVSFEDLSANHAIIFAKKLGGIWIREHVEDSGVRQPGKTKLAFGSNGLPGISYHGPNQVRFAQRSP